MVYIPANIQIWLATHPVFLQCIFVIFLFVECDCLSAKSIRS